MNKQVVIAGLLGAASAACEGPFVTEAEDHLAKVQASKLEIEAMTEGLDAQAAITQEAFEARTANVEAQQDIIAPFEVALETATENWDAKNGELEEINAAIDALALTVDSTSEALIASQELHDEHDELVQAQIAIMVKLDAAFDEHTTEKATLDGLKDDADDLVETTTQASEDAVQAKSDAIAARDEDCTGEGEDAGDNCVLGTVALLASATDTSTDASDGLAALEEDEDGTYATYAGHKKTNDKHLKHIELLTAACVHTGDDAVDYDCNGYANDPVLALLTALDGNTDSYASAVADNTDAWTDDVTIVATRKVLIANTQALTDIASEAKDADDLEITGDLTDAEGDTEDAKDAAIAAQELAVAAVEAVDGQLEQARLQQERGQAIMDELNEALVPLANDVTVKTYLKSVQEDLDAAQDVLKIAAVAELADLLELQGLAQETVDRANNQLVFYEGLLETALLARDMDATLAENNASAILATVGAIENAEAMLEGAISDCKQMGYAKAQSAKNAQDEQEADDELEIAIVAEEYALASALPAQGLEGAICAYPAKAKDAAQEPRPECNEGFCCGAAQKVMKDGTKLAIETCQNPLTRTYQYFPPLPARAVVQPTPETWRFQCISGAQKLAAAATAALAASYMMA